MPLCGGSSSRRASVATGIPQRLAQPPAELVPLGNPGREGIVVAISWTFEPVFEQRGLAPCAMVIDAISAPTRTWAAPLAIPRTAVGRRRRVAGARHALPILRNACHWCSASLVDVRVRTRRGTPQDQRRSRPPRRAARRLRRLSPQSRPGELAGAPRRPRTGRSSTDSSTSSTHGLNWTVRLAASAKEARTSFATALPLSGDRGSRAGPSLTTCHMSVTFDVLRAAVAPRHAVGYGPQCEPLGSLRLFRIGLIVTGMSSPSAALRRSRLKQDVESKGPGCIAATRALDLGGDASVRTRRPGCAGQDNHQRSPHGGGPVRAEGGELCAHWTLLRWTGSLSPMDES